MNSVYVFFLVGVDKGNAIFLTSSEWVKQVDDLREVRRPSALKATKFNEWMAELDCRVPILRDNGSYQHWINSDGGWAAIDVRIAEQLIPQWISVTPECMYLRIVEEADILTDVNLVRDIVLISRSLRLFGAEARPDDWTIAKALLSDLVLTRCQL